VWCGISMHLPPIHQSCNSSGVEIRTGSVVCLCLTMDRFQTFTMGISAYRILQNTWRIHWRGIFWETVSKMDKGDMPTAIPSCGSCSKLAITYFLLDWHAFEGDTNNPAFEWIIETPQLTLSPRHTPRKNPLHRDWERVRRSAKAQWMSSIFSPFVMTEEVWAAMAPWKNSAVSDVI
jgi:hypothetical protein